MSIITPSTSEITIVKGAIIEYCKDERGTVYKVVVHQPFEVTGGDVQAIDDAIDEFLGEEVTLVQESFGTIGTVGIKKWKVMYG